MDDQLVESARHEAEREAGSEAVARVSRLLDQAIAQQGPAQLDGVKHHLRRSKAKMRTCSYFLCDNCNQPIFEAEDGFIFHGNVYVANPTERGGLIGNNFPIVRPGTSINIDDVQETVLCHKCVFDILMLKKHYEPKRVTRGVEQTVPGSVGTGRDGFSPPRRNGPGRY